MSMNKSYIDNDKDHGHLLIYTALLAKKIFLHGYLSFCVYLPILLLYIVCPTKKKKSAFLP